MATRDLSVARPELSESDLMIVKEGLDLYAASMRRRINTERDEAVKKIWNDRLGAILVLAQLFRS